MLSDILARNINLLDYLRKLDKKLPVNTNYIVLKGSYLIISGILSPKEREMSDIDLLIKAEDLIFFEKAFSNMGFSKLPYSKKTFFKPMKNAPPIIFDIHLSLRHTKNTSNLFEKAEKLEGKAKKLPYEDNLLHIISHAFLHHGFMEEKEVIDIKKLCFFLLSQDILHKTIKKAAQKAAQENIYFLFALGLKKTFAIQASSELFSLKEKLFANFLEFLERRKSFFSQYAFEALYCPKTFFLRFIYYPINKLKLIFSRQDKAL